MTTSGEGQGAADTQGGHLTQPGGGQGRFLLTCGLGSALEKEELTGEHMRESSPGRGNSAGRGREPKNAEHILGAFSYID